MLKAIFKSNSGQKIVFDDFCTESEYDTVWVEMCTHCHNQYKNILGGRCSDKGKASGFCSAEGCDNEAGYYVGICSVEGCDNEADYYVDFKAKEIDIKEEL